MAEQKQRQPGAADQADTPQVDQLFADPTWKQQAERPGILEQLGRRLDTMLSSKSQSLKSYIEDIKLAYTIGIPVLGLLDDVLVIGYALKQSAAELERYRALQQDTRTAQAQ